MKRACMLALSLVGCTVQQAAERSAELERAVVTSGVSCAFVMNNDETEVVSTFCTLGQAGSTCRSDDPLIPDGPTCQNASGNPLQTAIDYATTNGKTRIKMDAGTFEFDGYQTAAYGWKVGLFIPSQLWISGWKPGFEPQTVIAPKSTTPPIDIQHYRRKSDRHPITQGFIYYWQSSQKHHSGQRLLSG